MTELKDSGSRSQFDTGAQRDAQEGKGRMDLLPFSALMELSKVFEAGANKYRANNWRRGIPLSRYADSGSRHFAKWMAGWRDEPHLEMAAWNFMCLIETQLLIKQGLLPETLNDLPYNPLDIEDNPYDIPPLELGDEGAENDHGGPSLADQKREAFRKEYQKLKPGDSFIVSNSSGFPEVVKMIRATTPTVEEQCRDWSPVNPVPIEDEVRLPEWGPDDGPDCPGCDQCLCDPCDDCDYDPEPQFVIKDEEKLDSFKKLETEWSKNYARALREEAIRLAKEAANNYRPEEGLESQ